MRATATRWVSDEPIPGIVEVQFAQHDGSLVTIHEKWAVVADRDLSKATSYPVDVLVDAEIVAASTPACAVRLLHGIEDISGHWEFTVSWDLVVTASDHPCRA